MLQRGYQVYPPAYFNLKNVRADFDEYIYDETYGYTFCKFFSLQKFRQ
jgi:hypothetical protein